MRSNIGYRRFTKSVITWIVIFTCFVAHAQDSRKNKQTCGPDSLKVICDMMGIQADRNQLYRLSNLNESGTTMNNLADAAYALGLDAVGMRLSLRELAKLSQPVIAWVQGNHFVVVEGIIGDEVRIIDPGLVLSSEREVFLLPKTEFSKIWQGHVLVISKKQMIQGDRPQISFEELVHNYGTAPQQTTITHQFTFVTLDRFQKKVNYRG